MRLTWYSPPRSGPSPQPHSQSCHHLTSVSVEIPLSVSAGNIGGGDRGGGRFRGLGGEGGCLGFVPCRRVSSCNVTFWALDGGDTKSRAACTSSNGETVICGVGAGGFANGSPSCSDWKVGDGVGVWRTSSWVKGTMSILSWDCRAAWFPSLLIEYRLLLRTENIKLARCEKSETRDNGKWECDSRAAFLRWRSATSHLLRF